MPVASSILAARSGNYAYSVSIAGALNVPLNRDQCVPNLIIFTGVLGANITVTFDVPASDAGAEWDIVNACSGNKILTLQAATGGGTVIIAQGKAGHIRWDGTNLVALETDTTLGGSAASGVNSDITSLLGLTGGIAGSGGILFDSLQGNGVALSYGYLAKTLPGDANYTLAANERGVRTLDVLPPGGGLTATRNIVLPLVAGALWDVYNGTTQSLQFIGSSGTGVTVVTLKRATLGCDGTNIVRRTADNP